MIYHTQETMPYSTLTNDTYERSVDNLKRYDGFGGNEKITNEKVLLEGL